MSKKGQRERQAQIRSMSDIGAALEAKQEAYVHRVLKSYGEKIRAAPTVSYRLRRRNHLALGITVALVATVIIAHALS
jgi:hypothetical protein